MDNKHLPPTVGGMTPWGEAQHVRLTHGVYSVSTAGHGGYFVPVHLLLRIPKRWRDFASSWSHGWGNQWYEEDCAALAVMVHIIGNVPQSELDKLANHLDSRRA